MSVANARWQIRAERPADYDIVETEGIFDVRNPLLLTPNAPGANRRFVVLDAGIPRHHAAALERYFECHGIRAQILRLPAGEQNKNLQTYLTIQRALDAFPFHRRDEPIIVVGGGVLCDVAGFAASCFRRGVPHIRIPTTLMAYVDAAVGVKTGFNFDEHKNRIGSFTPPLRVLLDRQFLDSLPRRHILNGVCEILKLAIIKDAALFARLEAHGAGCIASRFQDTQSRLVLNQAIDGMLAELAPNLFEDELARAVDFGHTLSYGLEHIRSDLLHGEAVLLDMVISTFIARRRHLLPEADATRILHLFDTLGIVPQTVHLDIERMWQSLHERTEHRNGLQRVPLPASVGQCVFVNDITRDEIEMAVRSVMNHPVRAILESPPERRSA
ncbi:MAG: iron-containing alcohol dehydrogenase [Castellaniella sp.]|nr:MAG: iron-containing alcohol dehydrogenase [Castellaniella sp.]